MNIKTVKELIELLKNTDIAEIEWTPERVRIVRGFPKKASGRRFPRGER